MAKKRSSRGADAVDARKANPAPNAKRSRGSDHVITPSSSPVSDTRDDGTAVACPLTERNINPAGKPPEAGVISKVYCENFMCHRKLTVDLCRNVNFVHGQNGTFLPQLGNK
jgi:structural maintenance of chromosomes protein 6